MNKINLQSHAWLEIFVFTAASPWPTAEPAHAQQNEQALLPSLNRSLDEHTFHTLAVVASFAAVKV